LPDVSKGFRRGSIHAGDRPVTLHGVVFDILVWEPPEGCWQSRGFQSVFAFAAPKLRRTPRFALRPPLGCATRSPKGEAWWARQDSNLQPDRYERWKLAVFPLEVPIFIEF
jgi:hypothetical protein